MTQTDFDFKPKKMSIRLMILEAMADGLWWRLEGLAAYCRNRHNTWVSDATISARLRELSKQGHPHETRPRGESKSPFGPVEYRLVR
jgi:hypothetical protein